MAAISIPQPRTLPRGSGRWSAGLFLGGGAAAGLVTALQTDGSTTPSVVTVEVPAFPDGHANPVSAPARAGAGTPEAPTDLVPNRGGVR